jgi:hypothetical protein
MSMVSWLPISASSWPAASLVTTVAERRELVVRGGAGGTSARLEDLEQAGAVLRSAADGLANHGRALVATSIDPRLQVTAALSPVTFARAEAALTSAAFGPGGLFALAARAELVSDGVRIVAEGYRVAEASTAGALHAVSMLTGQAIGRAVGALAPELLLGTAVVSVIMNGNGGGGDGDGGSGDGRNRVRCPEPLLRTGRLVLRLLAGRPGATEAAVGALPGVIGGFSSTLPGGPVISTRLFGHPTGPGNVAEGLRGLGVLGGLAGTTGGPPWLQDSNAVRVRVVPGLRRRPAADAADLLGRIPPTAPDRPMIHVERVDGVHGRRWVVSVPGTADWSPVAGRTPFDLTGDVRLIAGQRSAGMAGVVAALRATGVRKAEPVLLVGHSQGGLIAAAVAADPAVRREFTVSQVVTSGAPVASIPIPDDVQVLSIEHSDDVVPQLDGAANRDRPNWITVTAPAPTAEAPLAERTEPFAAHRADLYQRTAARIDRSTHPSIEHWRTGLAPFLDAAGRTGAGWDVEVTRVATP